MSARTVLIGNSGSGKTWLAQRLAWLRGAPSPVRRICPGSARAVQRGRRDGLLAAGL